MKLLVLHTACPVPVAFHVRFIWIADCSDLCRLRRLLNDGLLFSGLLGCGLCIVMPPHSERNWSALTDSKCLVDKTQAFYQLLTRHLVHVPRLPKAELCSQWTNLCMNISLLDSILLVLVHVNPATCFQFSVLKDICMHICKIVMAYWTGFGVMSLIDIVMVWDLARKPCFALPSIYAVGSP